MPSEADRQLLEAQLAELRQLPRQLLRSTSTKLTMAAAGRASEPDARVLLVAARILYVIADETEQDDHPLDTLANSRRRR